jgi:hypothetical protein
MNELDTTWARIVELAGAIDTQGIDVRTEERVVTLARLVIEFHRRVVSRPLRERATDEVACRKRIRLDAQ